MRDAAYGTGWRALLVCGLGSLLWQGGADAQTTNLRVQLTDGVQEATPGESLTYQLSVFNDGPADASGVTVLDTFPTPLSCVWTCLGTPGAQCTPGQVAGPIQDVFDMAAGSSAHYTVHCDIAADAAANTDGTLSNTATVTAPGSVTDIDPNDNSASDLDTLLVPRYDLVLRKSDGLSTVRPGDLVTYSITVDHSGSSDAIDVTVQDVPPAALEDIAWDCQSTSGSGCTANGSGDLLDVVTLRRGGQLRYQLSGTVASDASGTLHNVASLSIPDGDVDSNSSNDADGDSTEVEVVTDLSVDLTASPPIFIPGQAVRYTLVVSNRGPADVDGAQVLAAQILEGLPTALLEATWTCVASLGSACAAAAGDGDLASGVDLLAGGTATFQIDGQIDPEARGTLSNNAQVSLPFGVLELEPNDNQASLSRTLQAVAALSLHLDDGVELAVPGLDTRYALVVSNDGPSSALGVGVESSAPPSSDCLWTCQASGGGSCDAGPVSGDLAHSVDLPPGAQLTYEGRCAIASDAIGELVHSASLDLPETVDDPDLANNAASDTDLLTPQADLATSKTDGLLSLPPGGTTTYTITVRNASGPSLARQVLVQDTFPPSLTCTWTCQGSGGGICNPGQVAGNIDDSVHLPVGGRVDYTAQCRLASDAVGSLINSVTATAPAGLLDTNLSNNSALDSTDIDAVVDLAIELSDGVVEATPGDSLTYTLVVDNLGTSDAPGATVRDTFPAALSCLWGCVASLGGVCTAGQVSGHLDDTVHLPAGGQLLYTAHCDIAADARGVLSNRASVEPPAGVVDLQTGNNDASDLDTQLRPRADLAISKSDGLVATGPGGSLTYTVSASNLVGPSDAVDATVSDLLPAPLACTWSCAASGGATCSANPPAGDLTDLVQLPVGSLVTYNGQCDIAVDAAAGTLSNTATVSPDHGTFDPDLDNNSATDTTTLVAAVDLSLGLDDDGSEPVAGGEVTYRISVLNLPPSIPLANPWVAGFLPIADAVDVVGATVQDVFAPDLTCLWTCSGSAGGVCTSSGDGDIVDTVDLPVGSGLLYDIDCRLAADASGTLSNTATVTPPLGLDDSAPENNTATLQATIDQRADLVLSKSDGTTTATPGGSVTYTLVATNPQGPSDVMDAQVVDFFAPELTCLWSCQASDGASCSAGQVAGDIQDSLDLPVGSQVTYSAVCAIDAGARDSLSNTADLLLPSGVVELDDSNNRASDLDTVLVPSADLAVHVDDGLSQAVPGTSLTYTLTVSNAGPSAVDGAILQDIFPEGLSCLWSCTPGAGSSCTPGQVAGDLLDTLSLPVAGQVTYSAVCDIAADRVGTLSNTAQVTLAAPGPDPNPNNNQATDGDTLLRPTADLSLSKDDGVEVAHPGDTVTYDLTVRNEAGPSALSQVHIADVLTSNFATCSWSCLAAGGGACGAGLPSGDLSDLMSLPVGGQIVYSGWCQIADRASGALFNSAHLTLPDGSHDPDLNNNSAADVDTLVSLVDLQLDLEDGRAEALAGDSTLYTLEIGNRGPSPALGASVALPVPSSLSCRWTCQAGAGGQCTAGPVEGPLLDNFDLAADANVVYSGDCDIAPGATEPLQLSATATPAVGSQEANADDNSDDDHTDLQVQADLVIGNSDGQDSALPGEDIVYAISLRNDGPSDAASAVVESLFPSLLSCVWSCSPEAGASCQETQQVGDLSDNASLAPGSSVLYSAVCRIDDNAVGEVETLASVDLASGLDPDLDTNRASDVTLLGDFADLSLSLLDAPDPVAPGELLLYSTQVTNAGPVRDAAVQVTLQLPSQVSFVTAFLGEPGGLFADGFESGDLSAWQGDGLDGAKGFDGADPCALAGTTLVCDLGPLNASGTVGLVVVVEVAAGNGATLLATATVQGAGTDVDSSNNSAAQITSVGAELQP